MKAFSIVALAISLSFCGCAARVKTVTNLPPGVTQQQAQDWDAAVANLNKIADVTSALRQGLIGLNKNGGFPDGPQYILALQICGKIDEAQLAASAILKQTPNNFSASAKTQVQALMQQIAAQISTLNTQGVTGIKDPTSLKTISGLITQITSAAALILSL